MAKYHILFGFEAGDASKQIATIVRSQRNDVVCASRTTKESIFEYLRQQPSCNTLVLREVLETEAFTAEELAGLNDVRNYNIVVVIDSSHKGKDFMQVLYAAGITSALLIDTRSGAAASQIADLILNPRTRKNAREYYGMKEVKTKINMLTSDVYLKNYALLMDETKGLNIIDRYVMVVRSLPVNQAVEFTKKLPPSVLKRLMEYEEYYKVQDIFRKKGYKIRGRHPQNLKKGMSDEAFHRAVNGKNRAGAVKQGKRVTGQIEKGNKPPGAQAAKGLAIPEKESGGGIQEKGYDDAINNNVFTDGNNGSKGGFVRAGHTGEMDAGKSRPSQKKAGVRMKAEPVRKVFQPEKKKRFLGKKLRINWKVLVMVSIAGGLFLIIWYFTLALGIVI